MKRTPFKFAGQTVKIKPDVKRIGGEEFVIEDYWENIAGVSWMFSNGNPAAMEYGIRPRWNMESDPACQTFRSTMKSFMEKSGLWASYVT